MRQVEGVFFLVMGILFPVWRILLFPSSFVSTSYQMSVSRSYGNTLCGAMISIWGLLRALTDVNFTYNLNIDEVNIYSMRYKFGFGHCFPTYRNGREYRRKAGSISTEGRIVSISSVLVWACLLVWAFSQFWACIYAVGFWAIFGLPRFQTVIYLSFFGWIHQRWTFVVLWAQNDP